MTNITIQNERSGHSDIPHDFVRAHTLIALVVDRPGAVDRVVGLMRRRRANMHTLVLGRSALPDVVRVTVVVKDSEVAVEHLVEQMRKIVDVQSVNSFTEQEIISYELAFIKIQGTPDRFHEIFERAELAGAHVVDVSQNTVTLEVTGSSEKIERLIDQLEEFGIREVARSGRVAIARGESGF